MKRYRLAALLAASLIAVLLVDRGIAQEAAKTSNAGKPQAPSAELTAIRTTSQAFTEAFNRQDPQAIAELWTPDGDFVDELGNRYAGRDAIQAAYARFFAENPAARLRVIIDSVRLLNDLTAIEDGRTTIDPPPAGAPGMGKYTAIHIKVDGKWLMSTVRETRIETPSAYNHVADLEWLIGTWTAEQHGAKTESVCRWVANKSFVERNYTTTLADGTSTAGVQLIGWNPRVGHVQSWNFSADGGHAVGVWSPQEDGWAAEVHGVTGDGIPTAAVVLLKRLDDNAYVWQSIRRTVAEQSLPDTDEVVLRRRQAGP